MKKKDLLKPDIVTLIPTFGGRTGGYLWVWGQPVWHSETLSWKSIYMYEHTVSSSVFFKVLFFYGLYIGWISLSKILGIRVCEISDFEKYFGCMCVCMGELFWGWDSSLIMRLVISRCLIHISWEYVHNIF